MTTPDYAQPAAKLANGSMPLLGFGTWQIEDPDAFNDALLKTLKTF